MPREDSAAGPGEEKRVVVYLLASGELNLAGLYWPKSIDEGGSRILEPLSPDAIPRSKCAAPWTL